MRNEIRFHHSSIWTEQTCLDWIRRFILFHVKRRPGTLGVEEIEAFLKHLAAERKAAAGMQNQAS